MNPSKHRRRKAAAKMHLNLDLRSLLPKFVVIDTAKTNDAKEARTVYSTIKSTFG